MTAVILLLELTRLPTLSTNVDLHGLDILRMSAIHEANIFLCTTYQESEGHYFLDFFRLLKMMFVSFNRNIIESVKDCITDCQTSLVYIV